MKRILIVFTFMLILIPNAAYAAEDEYNDYLNTYDFTAFDDLSSEIKDVLDELGVSDFDYQKISNMSLTDVLDIIKDVFLGKIQGPVKASLTVVIFIIMSAFFQSFKITDGTSLNEIYSTITSLVISTLLIVKIGASITSASAALGIAADFIYAFIPLFCAIVAAGGGITTGFSTNSMLLILSQGLSFISSNILLPITNCFLALGICSGMRSELNLGSLISTLKRVISSSIAFCAAAFVSVLSIKTAVSARADILGIRSVRFLINSIVPVIGGTISEGLLSIQSYSALIRSSVGIVGIIAVTLVFLPSITEVVIWRLTLSLCSIISDIFCDKSVSLVINAFRDTLLILNVILILSMVTTIISIGLLIAARTA